MAPIRERGRRDSARRQQILNSALELFATRAYEDVSVDDVCDHAGVAHGLISYYFGGKRRLFGEAVRQAWNELLEYERPREDERDAPERIHGFVRRHFEYVAEHPHRFTTLMRTGHADREVYDIVIGARGEALAELKSSLGCPVNPAPRLRAALHGWMGYLDTMTLDWALHRDLDLDAVTDMCVQALIGAVRTTAGDRYDPDVELATLNWVAVTSTPAALPGA